MRTIVLGDFHLHHGPEVQASRDMLSLVRTLCADGPLDVVLSGDIYDLAVAGDAPIAERLARIVQDQPSFHLALAEVQAHGGDVALVPGNHDYELLLPEGVAAFGQLVPQARIQPWFLRVHGHTHVEHGNMYDPDNAHPHPLEPAGDPLGIMITRQILARLGDLRLLHTNGKTPLPVLWRCFVNYGMRTPEMVARYVLIGLKQVFAKKPAIANSAQGLYSLHPRPTHLHGPTLFARMYLDRILTTFVLGLASVLSAAFAPNALPYVLGLGVLSLLVMSLRGNRYAGRVEALLTHAAHQVAEQSGAQFVVFGHAHVPFDDGVYLNTGSFGFPAEDGFRVFVEVDRHGARHRRMQPAGTLQSSPSHQRRRSALYAYAQKRLGRVSEPRRKSRNKR